MAHERVEVLTSAERRRRWSGQDKLRLVAESYEADGGIAEVAGRADLHPSLLQRWRRQVRDGTLLADRFGPQGVVPFAIGDAAGTVGALRSPVACAPTVRGLVEIDLPNGRRVRVEQHIPAVALRRISGTLVRR